jgi:ribosomal protein S18 acetylase RimI-like enzyme
VSAQAANGPEHLFANPVWHALHSRHREFAVGADEACRYPADVAPFGAVAVPGPAALRQLRALLVPGESVWLFGRHDLRAAELRCVESLECLQMLLEAGVAPLESALHVQRLAAADAPAMVALTELAFPGFFRARTCAMGTYYGAFDDGALVAMGGERLMLDGYAEISGVCTHPGYRGRGYARQLIGQLMHDHHREGLRSWLHVGATNVRAIALYASMGFSVLRRVTLERLRRDA